MLIREYRILMPLTVEEYRIGQRYMIARAQYEAGFEGDKVVQINSNSCFNDKYGHGTYRQKNYHLDRHFPSWAQKFLPNDPFFVNEESWSYYPIYNLAKFSSQLTNRISLEVESCYEDNFGTNDNALNLSPEELAQREIIYIDVVNDVMSNSSKDALTTLKGFQSKKICRGPFADNWAALFPGMCSYKVFKLRVDIFGIKTIAESTIQSKLQEVLLKSHRESVLWLDEWIDITEGEIIEMENMLDVSSKLHLGKIAKDEIDQNNFDDGDFHDACSTI